MSKRKLSAINSYINEKLPEKKFRSEHPLRRASEHIKFDSIDSEEDSLSNSMSSLSLSDTEDIQSEESEYKPSDYTTLLKKECNDDEFNQLNPLLDNLCQQMEDKKITISKILKSNLLSEEKEKALELYGALLELDQNTLDYIELHKLLQDMVAGSLSHLSSPEAIKSLKVYQQEILDETPSLDKIMAAKISRQDKMLTIQLFQTFYQLGLEAGGIYSADWFSLRKRIIDLLKNTIDNQEEYDCLEKEESKLKSYHTTYHSSHESLKKNILLLDIDMKRKKKLYDMYEIMNHTEDERDRNKLLVKLKWLINLPYDKVSQVSFDIKNKLKVQDYCDSVYNHITTSIYGMNEVKEKLLIHINNRLFNKKTMSILALKGKPGVGKTKIIKALSEATNIPYAKLSLGGISDTTLIYGHNQVWDNSGPGMIMQHMARTKCSDMIILLDEIDKLSNTEKGLEVQHALLHMLDQTQNNEFHDAYLDEFPHDISRIWFIATLNDDNALSGPLKDRLDIIDVPSYTKEETSNIIIKHILPQANIECGLKSTDITISESATYMLINKLMNDIKKSGMRLVEKTINDLVLKLSYLSNSNTNVSFKLNDFNGFPYRIEKKTIKQLYPDKLKSSDIHHMMYS